MGDAGAARRGEGVGTGCEPGGAGDGSAGPASARAWRPCIVWCVRQGWRDLGVNIRLMIWRSGHDASGGCAVGPWLLAHSRLPSRVTRHEQKPRAVWTETASVR
jgi:hypothetical protein